MKLAPCPSCGRDVPDDADVCPYCATRWDTSTRDDRDGPRTIGSAGTQEVKLDDDEERYTIVDELGQGGMGKVYLAFDRRLRRNVAYKVLRVRDGGSVPDPDDIARFVSECQAAAQIEHPNVVPIYDFGQRREDGAVYFTMKYIEGKTLGDHIRAVKAGSPDPGMTRFRLLQILHQVMLAVSYMHKKHVLHRDIKPQNIMVGQFGEVFLVDFGLHKIRGQAVTTIRTEAGNETPELTVQGTPSYMPPEQVEDSEAVDETSDQWALGAVLYEILTFQPPYAGPAKSIWARALDGSFPKPSEIDPDVPKRLEEICLKAMSKPRHLRFESVKEMAAQVQEFLDGEKELARREKLGAESLAAARKELRRYEGLEKEVLSLREAIQRAGAEAAMGEAPEVPVRRLRERHRRLADTTEEAFPGVTQAYVHAIEILPNGRIAREELADLAFRKFLEAEQSGKRGEMRILRALVESYHDGRYEKELEGEGVLSLATDPDDAHAYLSEYEEGEGRLVLGQERYLGETPLQGIPLSMGSYVATLRREGCVDTSFPFVIARCEGVDRSVTLLPPERFAPGFAYIPGGSFLKGGDPLHGDTRMEVVELPSFCIGRHPVTVAEYLDFINAIASTEGPDAAARHVPRLAPEPTSPDGYYFVREGSRFVVPPRDVDNDEWDLRWPVMAISAADAETYCRWRAEIDGFEYRLPSSDEWEKAARGADGRLYPWGNGWSPGFSHSLTATSQRSPLAVDSNPEDVSPFGVFGMAGNVRDWTSTPRPGAMGLRTIRGGSYAEAELVAQIPVLSWTRPEEVSTDIGFRLAYSCRPSEMKPVDG